MCSASEFCTEMASTLSRKRARPQTEEFEAATLAGTLEALLAEVRFLKEEISRKELENASQLCLRDEELQRLRAEISALGSSNSAAKLN